MNWYRKEFVKLSWNHGIPLMEDPDSKLRDPYNHRNHQPNDTNTEQSRLGDEDGLSGGLGSRVRGLGFAKNISPSFDDNYKDQMDSDIPTDHTLLDPEMSFGDGPDSETFADPVDQPNTLLHMDQKNKEPIGPHNMHSKPTKSVFDLVARNQKR